MDPLSIAMMAQSGLSSMGSLFSGIMSFNADNDHAKALNYAAEQAREESGVNAQEALQQGDEAVAKGAVTAAANGGGLVGSSVSLLSSLSDQAMFNARAATYRGLSESQNDLYQAKVAKQNAINGLIGGVTGAGSQAAGGWAQNAYQGQILQSLGGRLGDAGGMGSMDGTGDLMADGLA